MNSYESKSERPNPSRAHQQYEGQGGSGFMPDTPQQRLIELLTSDTAPAQMKPDTSSKAPEEEEIQMKPDTSGKAPEEEEVQMKPDTSGKAPEEEEIQMKPDTSGKVPEEEEVQMKPDTSGKAPEEEEIQMKPGGQPSRHQQSSSSGSTTAMPEAVQAKMEQAFGTDFSQVSIHADSPKATDMGAQAYAQGHHIHFAPGRFDPSNIKGQELLAHELAHVVQQREGRVRPTAQAKGLPVNADPALEKEADEQAKAAVQGKKVSARTKNRGSAKSSALQKKDDQKALDRLAPEQMVYEYAAHNLVYKEEGYEPNDYERELMKNAGYRSKVVWYGKSSGAKLGFQAVLIRPLKSGSGKKPILAIRGTFPGKSVEQLMTIYSDLDAVAVGAKQFAQNRALIGSILSSAGGAVVATGHSLGGAMAQHTGVHFSGSVSQVVTFQSPGIDRASVERFQRLPADQRPKATHHIVTGDIVDKAGDANLPGEVYEHNFGRELNLRKELDTVAGHYENAKKYLDDMVRSLNGIVQVEAGMKDREVWGYSVPLPSVGMSVDFGPTEQAYQGAKREIAALKEFAGRLPDIMDGILESHTSVHVFNAPHYDAMKAAAGMPPAFMSRPEARTGPQPFVTRHAAYPHEADRAIAEPVRDLLGPKLESLFEAYFAAVELYEAAKRRYGQAKEMGREAYDQGKEHLRRGYEQVRDWLFRLP